MYVCTHNLPEQALEWFPLPPTPSPTTPNPQRFGIAFDCLLIQVNTALSRVDNIMKSLFDGLRERGVEECVNLIIVSDHGMATYNSTKLVHLKEVRS
jgi:ectonucleotide pyrophosphatase/phosphodiesterase family protein 1/3